MNDLYRKNISFIKKNWRGLYDELEKTTISNIKISIDGGNINYHIGDIQLYPDNSSEYLGKKLEQFFAQPGYLGMDSVPLLPKDEVKGVLAKSGQFLVKFTDNIPSAQNISSVDRAKHLDALPVLIMFGVGTAQQIEQLIDLVEIRTLILVDIDYKMFKASLHIVNWEKIITYFTSQNRNFQLVIGTNTYQLSATVINHIFENNRGYVPFIPYFFTYNIDFFKEVLDNIYSNYKAISMGWGFYDDELMSITHTFANINNNIPVYLGNKKLSKASSVFIVGNGPSIDDDIEYIKQYKDKVVIFSCGSALKVFEKHNIIPDYHIETERTEAKYDVISENFSKDFLKQINLIGLNVLHSKVLTLFKSAKIICRANDAAGVVMPSYIPQVKYTNPTVVNGALAFTSHIGFENIYLFGADMGYRDKKYHHSKVSSYFDKNSKVSKKKINTIEETVKANFSDEQLYTTSALLFCKKEVENCIVNYASNYYNCSDGAYLRGTTPLRSKNIDLSSLKSKELLLKQIEQNFITDLSNIKKDSFILLKKDKKYFDTNIYVMIDILKNSNITSFKDFFILIDEVKKVLFLQKNSLLYIVLNGTFNTMLKIVYFYALGAENFEDSIKFLNFGVNTIREFLEFAKDDFNNIYKELNNV